MKIFDKRTEYTINENSKNVNLTGKIIFTETGIVGKFQGKLYDNNKNMVGEFYYNEVDDQRYNKSLTSAKKSLMKESEDLIDLAIKNIKKQLEK